MLIMAQPNQPEHPRNVCASPRLFQIMSALHERTNLVVKRKVE